MIALFVPFTRYLFSKYWLRQWKLNSCTVLINIDLQISVTNIKFDTSKINPNLLFGVTLWYNFTLIRFNIKNILVSHFGLLTYLAQVTTPTGNQSQCPFCGMAPCPDILKVFVVGPSLVPQKIQVFNSQILSRPFFGRRAPCNRDPSFSQVIVCKWGKCLFPVHNFYNVLVLTLQIKASRAIVEQYHRKYSCAFTVVLSLISMKWFFLGHNS